ncbi:MAG: hypothetical protein CMJ59_05520, partial [Planctomycetaceae bacterium]|nr:hypothetical protein [Planctomycetaceae bacterium]
MDDGRLAGRSALDSHHPVVDDDCIRPTEEPPMTRLPGISRRTILQAGSIGLLGLDLAGLSAVGACAAESPQRAPAKSVLFIFLSGGLSQLDSFDMKP